MDASQQGYERAGEGKDFFLVSADYWKKILSFYLSENVQYVRINDH